MKKLSIQKEKEKFIKLKSEKELLEKQKEQQELKLEKTITSIDMMEKVKVLLQKTSEYAREKVKSEIEKIVTKALGIVFTNRNYKFVIDIVDRANRIEVDFYLETKNADIKLETSFTDLMTGGGVLDVISLSLFLAINQLTNNTGPVFLDEAGKHVDKNHSIDLAYFIKEFSKNLDKQIVLITHNNNLQEIGDKNYNIKIKNEKSVIQEV